MDSKMDQVKFMEGRLKKFERYGVPKQTMLLHIFKKLSSTTFSWSIFEYFDSFSRLEFYLDRKTNQKESKLNGIHPKLLMLWSVKIYMFQEGVQDDPRFLFQKKSISQVVCIPPDVSASIIRWEVIRQST